MILNVQKYWVQLTFMTGVFSRYAGSFFGMILLGLASGGFESVGIASVIPLFYLVTGQAELTGTERISKLIQWLFSTLHVPLSPTTLLIFIALLFVLKAIVQVSSRYIAARTVATFEEDARRTLFRRTLGTGWPFLSRQRLGHLEGVLLFDVERGASLASSITAIITMLTTFVMYIAVAATISGRITSITLALGVFLFICFKPLFSRIRRLQAKAVATQKDLNHHVAEHMLSAKSIKALSIEDPVIEGANAIFAKLRSVKIRTALFRQSTLAVIEPAGFMLIAALFIYSYHRSGFAFASFAVVMYLVNQMFNYLQSLQTQLHVVNEFIPYLRSVMKYRRLVNAEQESDIGGLPFSFQRTIDFKRVSFSYTPEKTVLTDINLSITRGSHVAIVGPSGVGKTTFVDLLLRLHTPSSGHIESDGIHIDQFNLHSWRRNIGYVPQDGLLLNTTVKENIRFYDTDISDQDIIDATKAANIYDTIMALPHGFDTTTGERGVELSGGQRQRIILARALARKPAVIILDEATSSIDSESEALIQHAIESLHGHVTIITITHRVTSTLSVDRIVVLADGGISEEGSPQQLLQNPSSYVARLLDL